MLSERTVLLTIIVSLILLLIATCKQSFGKPRLIDVCNSAILHRCDKSREIPSKLIQSWKSRDAVPDRIFEGIRKYAPEFEHVFFSDEDVVTFLSQNYPSSIMDTYNSTPNAAHRADLFRYCYLYMHGGVWLDIKTVLIRPLREIFTSPRSIYTVKSIMKYKTENTCYQGILAVPPRTPFMHDMIVSFVSSLMSRENVPYLTFCHQMYAYIEQEFKNIQIGRNDHPDMHDLHLFEEYEKKPCKSKRDRYNLCTFVRNGHGEDLFKIRDHEFPTGAWRKR